MRFNLAQTDFHRKLTLGNNMSSSSYNQIKQKSVKMYSQQSTQMEADEKMDQYYEQEAIVVQERRKQEPYRWDIKFQNCWSYQVAALFDFQMSINMSQKMFKLVGKFRNHAQNHFLKIVESLYSNQNIGLKAWERDQTGLVPVPPEQIIDDLTLYVDDEDREAVRNGL